ncbi:MAG: ABC transporter substrate-binding protein [Pseudomonadota bacterium]
MAERRGYITRQAKRLTNGEINRRRFVMSALSAGVTLPTAMSLAAKAESRVPKRGGTLRIAMNHPAPIRSGQMLSDLDALVALGTGNALTEITTDGTVRGELAEHVDAVDSHRIWQLELRDDVFFADGAPLTAQDIVATLDGHPLLAPSVVSLTVDGPRGVRFELHAADRYFAHRLADPRLVIRSAHDDGRHLTGAYRLEGADKKGVLQMVRRDGYWKPGCAHFDAIRLTPMADVTARQHAVMAGDVDYADGIDPRACELLRRTPGIKVMESDIGRRIDLQLEQADAAGLAALEALEDHLPRQAILDQLLLGHGTIGPRRQFGTTDAALPDRPFEVAIQDTGVPSLKETAQIVTHHLAERGMHLHVTNDGHAADFALVWRTVQSWERGSARQATTLVTANELSACRSNLAHPDRLATHAAHDGGRLLERWWFA